jgi:anthranilate phosphoribosyltransferase
MNKAAIYKSVTHRIALTRKALTISVTVLAQLGKVAILVKTPADQDIPPRQWQAWLPLAMAGQLSEAQLDAYMPQLLLSAMSEATMTELLAFLTPQLPAIPASVIQAHPLRLDVCGTGGSGLAHFNTSTTVAIVLAAMGITVIKLGNRSATSQAGSSDFLGALGLPVTTDLTLTMNALERFKLGFIHAPVLLPGLGHLAAARKRLKQPTAFNVLGPLLNPFLPTHKLLGCSRPEWSPWLADKLAQQGCHGWVVTGHHQQDDLTPWGQTHIWTTPDRNHQHFEGGHPVPNAVTGAVTRTDTAPQAGQEAQTTLAHNLQQFWQVVTPQPTGLNKTQTAYQAETYQPEAYQPEPYQLVCHNAAAALCVLNKAKTIQDAHAQVEAFLATGQVNNFAKAYLDFFKTQ